MNRFRKLLKDKRGASLVYVIVAAAIIILLGAATTTVAYANLQATKVQTKSDNNFYSADSVMNAIVGGLEDDFSKAYDEAYTEIVTRYGHPEQLEAKKKEDPNFDPDKLFKETWQKKMSEILNDKTQPTDQEVSGFYSIERLQKHVQETLSEDVNYTISAVGGHNVIDKTEESGLIIRNLHVTYEDDTGYYDEITTDVKLTPPELGQLQPPIQFDDILLVADDGFESRANSHITMQGNMYLGKMETNKLKPFLISKNPDKYEKGDDCAISIDDHASDIISSPKEIIAGGNILVQNFGDLSLKTSQDNKNRANFWLENISILREAVYSANGNSYVYDDLEANGAYSKVVLGGTYMGFSKIDANKSKAHAESSSININGAHTTLDFRNLEQLVIAGSSYLKASAETGSNPDKPDTDNPNTDIELGEAFSVKSNQIAYLVDEKGFTDGLLEDVDGFQVFKSNPMSYAQFETLKAAEFAGGKDWKEAILTAPLSFDSSKDYKTLNADDVVPVFSNKDGGTVYLYLTFKTTDAATAYFNEISKSSSLTAKRLRTYTEQYIKEFTINESTKFYTNSNFIRTMALDSEEKYSKGIKNDDGTITYDENNIQRIFPKGDSKINGLGYKGAQKDALMPSIPTLESIKSLYPVKITEVTFDTKINEDMLKDIISIVTTTSITTDQNTNNDVDPIDNGVIFKGTDGSKAIFIDNASPNQTTTPSKPYVVETDGSGIIIATGDVELKANWRGTIIARGRVYSTKENAKNKPVEFIFDASAVSSALSLYVNVNEGAAGRTTIGPINAFKSYENFNPKRATQEEGENANIIKNCITFSNWNKE